MPDQTIATAHWRALDREGTDRCRLSRAAHGWLLVGHARFRDAQGFAALDYVLRCNEQWQTLSADIAGLHEGREVQLRILREAAQWWLNETPQPEVAGALDLYLPFTPATNLMPLSRLLGSPAEMLDVTVAWLNYPDAALIPREQVYRRTSQAEVIAFEAHRPGTDARLTLDPSGFVTLYPGRWEGEVTVES